jgi:hypothetical protein
MNGTVNQACLPDRQEASSAVEVGGQVLSYSGIEMPIACAKNVLCEGVSEPLVMIPWA